MNCTSSQQSAIRQLAFKTILYTLSHWVIFNLAIHIQRLLFGLIVYFAPCLLKWMCIVHRNPFNFSQHNWINVFHLPISIQKAIAQSKTSTEKRHKVRIQIQKLEKSWLTLIANNHQFGETMNFTAKNSTRQMSTDSSFSSFSFKHNIIMCICCYMYKMGCYLNFHLFLSKFTVNCVLVSSVEHFDSN